MPARRGTGNRGAGWIRAAGIAVVFLVLVVVQATAADPAAADTAESRSLAWSKAHAGLVRRLEQDYGRDVTRRGVPSEAADQRIEVLAWVRSGSDLGGLLERALVRPFVDALGTQAVIGTIRVGSLHELLEAGSVIQVRLPESPLDPPRLPVDLPPSPAPDAGAQAFAKDWFEVTDIHGSRAAWERGFTGAGVKVLVNDSGIDFCHPDLAGTWARVDDPASPYAGWPLAFDSYSMYLLARDQRLGETNIAAGLGDYADTSATCSLGGCSYRPLGAPRAHTYVLPPTSRSGVYHIGSHPDQWLDWDGEGRAAVLVVDEQTAGVYDTVYVDLDHDHDFTNDPQARRTSPSACGSYGTLSYSGGLVYWIADGSHPVPASDWLWQLDPPDAGTLVAFAIVDFVEPGGTNHGQLCASAVAAQGVVNGGAPGFKPPYAGPGDGMVRGAAPDAELIGSGNIYRSPFDSDPFVFAALGYDGVPETGDDAQIVTNSYGNSATDNDGWDLSSRMIDATQRSWGPHLSILFSAGNAAPGYGTVAPPQPEGAISVGASTEFGSAGLDQVRDSSHITQGDVASFSSRGPNAQGETGVHVVAGGARATGCLAVNQSSDDVDSAWQLWGGTSRACPVAGGNLALVYDAYRQAHGQWPDHETARALLMAGAESLHYDTFAMGAGRVDAERSTAFAAGTLDGGAGGLTTTPPFWNPGDYRGVSYPGFAHLVWPGASSRQGFSVTNSGSSAVTATLRATRLVRSAPSVELDWTTGPVSREQALDEHRPHYLAEITGLIPEGTELMVARCMRPLAELDSDADYRYDSRWYLVAYDWSDDGDGELWRDDGDGTVAATELDPGDQYARFNYDANPSTTKAVWVQRPLERMHDGVWLGLQHHVSSAAIQQTHFRVRLEFYAHERWSWVSLPDEVVVPAGGEASFEASLAVPGGTPAGVYQGALEIDDGTHVTTIPVAANVAARLGEAALQLAGAAAGAGTGPYDSGVVQGLFDWGWRADSGDWRFFAVDVPEPQPEGARLLVQTTWEDGPGRTDLDTLVFGPTPEPEYGGDVDFFGPHALATVGGSPNRYVGNGVWLFETTSGGHEDWVSAPLVPGLHVIAVHNVLYQGETDFQVPFSVTVGRLLPSASALAIQTPADQGTVTYRLETGMALDEIQVEAFGLSCGAETISDRVANGGTVVHHVQVDHAARLEVELDGDAGNDLDLHLLDPNGVEAASSTSGGADERVVVDRPADGLWRVEVRGISVPGGSTAMVLAVDLIQGRDLQVLSVPDGPVAAGETVDIELGYSMPEGGCTTRRGMLVYGPPGGLVVQVPITIELRISERRRPSGRLRPVGS